MSEKKIVLKYLNNSDLTSKKDFVKNHFHYVIRPDGSWIQFLDDKETEKIIIGCVRNNQGELFCGAQDSGLSELIRILSTRHNLNSQVISFENDGHNHQTLANVYTSIDSRQIEFWKDSDVAHVDDKPRKLPEMMIERKGILFAPLFWLMNVLGFENYEKDNYLKFWRKK